eukprot:c18118_g1_i2 orf=639-1979(+)
MPHISLTEVIDLVGGERCQSKQELYSSRNPSNCRRNKDEDNITSGSDSLQSTTVERGLHGLVGKRECQSNSSELHSETQKCSNSNNDAMDEQLWSRLPDHLLENILAWLPFWSLLRFKSVCKRWNCITDSKNFLGTYSQAACRHVLFIMFADHLQHKVAAAYNPVLDRWHLIPLSHILPSEPSNYFLILAAAGGLLCVEDMGWPYRSLIVSNLLTRSHRKLPPMIHMKSPYVVGMIADANREEFKILVAQDGENLTSQYYDSKSNSWRMSGSFNRRVALVGGTVFLKGFLYCLTFGPVGLVAYNVEEGSWHEVQVTMPPSLTCPHVIENRGQLMVVGGLEESGTLKSIGIWQLDMANKSWVEVQRMPDHFFRKLFKAARGNFFCVGHGGLICFNHNHSSHILMFDMTNQRWWWLSPCPLTYTLKRQSVLGVQSLGFCVEPWLDVMV